MRAQLESLVDELKQLRSEGIETIYLEDQTLNKLRTLSSQSQQPAAVQTPPASAVESEPKDSGTDSDILSEWNQEPKTTDKKTATKKKTAVKPVAPIPSPTPFTLPEGDKASHWSWLKDKVLTDQVCQEHAQLDRGNRVVFGVGNLDADIFFCGEAPGADEALQGEPFVGKAGQLLNKIIAAMGLKREQVYIGNIMNWRPEHDKPYGNRPPTESEMAYCLPYLEAQVAIVQPKVIVALGKTAAGGLLTLEPSATIGRLREGWFEYKGTPLAVTYHPSYLLRNASEASKRLVWEDMLRVMAKIELPVTEKQRSYFLPKD